MTQTGSVAEGRLSDWISLGVLASWVPRDAVDEAVEATGKGAKRKVRIPIESDHLFRSNPIADSGVSDHLDLRGLTLVGQDWGGLIGLRLVAEHPDRFARVVAANTGLPTGDQPMPDVWLRFREVVRTAPTLSVSRLVQSGCQTKLPPEVLAAYEAPFPDPDYAAAVRAMPQLVPTSPDDPAAEANRAAWRQLAAWDKPFLVAFSDRDPITGSMAPVLKDTVPGATGLEHPVIEGAGHFLQEDAGQRLGAVIADFVRAHPAG